MQHLKRVDEHHSTVIMVQVENEVGLLGDSRDRSDLAEQAFKGPVPNALIDFLRGDWSDMSDTLRSNFEHLRKEAFAKDLTWADLTCDELNRDELFMAYHYARYVNTVASAGKEAYPLPLYTNVWQNYGDSDRDPNGTLVAAGGDKPGDYPSGGGVANALDIWQQFAPCLDLIAPDIYLNDYAKS